ncbi:MAG: D-gamma-glutamyl-meso-diaminopimelic acid endopeptidase CwlS [Chlamydiae bacterium]|nr:D-gamma-glutamyl-meso-diaminopimelic acid endopeptidase CwlS [Chlamydiota bacterium]
MNRKDIIIVAVLLNAGLLVTLFVSSVKRESSVKVARIETINKESIAARPLSPLPRKRKNQIDKVLSQYSAKTLLKEKKNAALPTPVLTPAGKKEGKTPFKAPLENQVRTVTVEKGDVLEKIARSHGVSVEEIMKINRLSNTRLQIGQELKLPKRRVAAKKKKAGQSDGKYYVVKGGDNPWTIAQKNNIQVEELLRLNNMDEAKAKRLRPGDRLRIK